MLPHVVFNIRLDDATFFALGHQYRIAICFNQNFCKRWSRRSSFFLTQQIHHNLAHEFTFVAIIFFCIHSKYYWIRVKLQNNATTNADCYACTDIFDVTFQDSKRQKCADVVKFKTTLCFILYDYLFMNFRLIKWLYYTFLNCLENKIWLNFY